MRTVASALAPKITGQPINRIAAPSETVTFSVVVSDARAVTFQWKFNGTDIPGATGDSLLLTNVNPASEGQYSVVVTNSEGSVTSAPAELLLDFDRDELPDSWETAHFGSTDSQRSAGDPDSDGVSNLDEFLDGTDPNVKGSLRPRLTALQRRWRVGDDYTDEAQLWAGGNRRVHRGTRRTEHFCRLVRRLEQHR